MYDFKFVKVVKGKSESETFGSANGAHTAMGIYAGQNDLNVSVHNERWRHDSKSLLYKGDNPMFGTVGYVIQDVPVHTQDYREPTPGKKTKSKNKKTK